MGKNCRTRFSQNVVKILGLKFNHKYEDTKQLRYGHLMIMTDQDHDGSHIKGERVPTVCCSSVDCRVSHATPLTT